MFQTTINYIVSAVVFGTVNHVQGKGENTPMCQNERVQNVCFLWAKGCAM